MNVVLGPVPCKACRQALWWDGSWWRDVWRGSLHLCPAKAKAA